LCLEETDYSNAMILPLSLINENKIFVSYEASPLDSLALEKNRTYILNLVTMNKRGPIIIIEDDLDDQEILVDIFKELNYDNKLVFFADSVQALEYLTDTEIEPFLVLSDINMPKLNGMQLREKIHNNEDLRLKSIPYLFFSTSAEQQHVIEAYSRSIQGFFVKPNDYDKLKKTIVKIVEYWQECESPNYIKNAQ
jgi:CheY-like chemotaxis protein